MLMVLVSGCCLLSVGCGGGDNTVTLPDNPTAESPDVDVEEGGEGPGEQSLARPR